MMFSVWAEKQWCHVALWIWRKRFEGNETSDNCSIHNVLCSNGGIGFVRKALQWDLLPSLLLFSLVLQRDTRYDSLPEARASISQCHSDIWQPISCTGLCFFVTSTFLHQFLAYNANFVVISFWRVVWNAGYKSACLESDEDADFAWHCSDWLFAMPCDQPYFSYWIKLVCFHCPEENTFCCYKNQTVALCNFIETFPLKDSMFFACQLLSQLQ